MINFNDDALAYYRDELHCESLHRLYTEIEPPPELTVIESCAEYPVEEELQSSAMDIDSLLPRSSSNKNDNSNGDKMDVEKKTVSIRPGAPTSLTRVVVNETPPAASVFKLFAYFSRDMVQALSLPFTELYETVHDKAPPSVETELMTRQTAIETVIRTFVTRMILELFTVDDRGTKIKQILSELEETYLLGSPVKKVASCSNNNNNNSTQSKPANKQQPKRAVVRGGKSNFINVDAIHRSATKTCRESMSSNDLFYQKCSDARKRGRRPMSEKNNQPDRIDQIKSNHILSQKSVAPITYSEEDDKFYTMAAEIAESVVVGVSDGGSGSGGNSTITTTATPTSYAAQSVVDFYPVFMKVMENFHACIPCETNHGIYLDKLGKAVRRLTPKEWPFHGLCKSIMNAEHVYPLKQVTLAGGDTNYHCAFSGIKLRPGERVWHLRLLVNSGCRYRKWVLEGKLPPCPMHDPVYTRSIRAYFIKLSLVGPCSLFFATPAKPPQQSAVKSATPNQQPKVAKLPPSPTTTTVTQLASKSELPPNRMCSVNTLWLVLNQLRVFVAQNDLDSCVWSKKHPGIPYRALLNQLVDVFCVHQSSEQAAGALDSCLIIGSFMADRYTHHVDSVALFSDARAMEYVAMLRDTVLDFVDLMFPFIGGGGGSSEGAGGGMSTIMVHQFSLYEFGIKHDEKAKKPLWAKPVLSDAGTGLLTNLFAMSHERYEARGRSSPDHQEKKERIERLEQALCRHPFIFLALFTSIYNKHSTPQKPSFKESTGYLRAMGLYINTDVDLVMTTTT